MSQPTNDGALKSLQQQIVLAKFGELALRCDDLDEILTEACRLVGDALGTDLAKVAELQADGRTLLVRAGVGWKSGVVGVVTIDAADDTSEMAALRTGDPMISPNIDRETRFQCPPFLIANGVKAVINVVVIGRDGGPPFGILQVASRQPRKFAVEDTAFLRSYANLIAAAVHRLRAKERLEAKAEELAEMNTRLRTQAQEREQFEETLRQSQKMEAVGQLTGGLAHDFNNLLTSISTSLELLRNRVAQGWVEDLDRYIDEPLASVNRATALTHRLLAFSRVQTLDPKVTDLNRLIRNMEYLFRRTAGPSIQFEAELSDDLWPTFCDPNQVENVLLNLVINARDAMPDGGQLLLATTNIVVASDRENPSTKGPQDLKDGDYVVLSITDTGTGMSPSVLAHAFEPFFTTKPTGQGTGLGLSMIHGFVRQSGGGVYLRSTEGEGTIVMIYLPRCSGMAVDAVGVEDVAILPTSTGAVVLVVDDEPGLRANIVELLDDLGYTTLDADDGPAALDILETTPRIDLLITDVGLPRGLNGRQLADAARRRRPTLKVLFITGYAEAALVEKGVLERGMEVMTKPFRAKALAARVEAILGA